MSDPLKVLGVEPNKNFSPQIKTVLIKSIDGKLNKIKVSTSDEEDNIEKGMDHGKESDFTFDKLGSEIKEKLIRKKQEEEVHKQIQLQNLISLIKQIGVEPTESCPSYYLRGLLLNVDLLPKKYGFETQTEGDINPISSIASRSDVLTPEKTLDIEKNRRLKSDYNQAYEKYIDCLIEISFMEALINNLVEDQIYQLCTKQLINFGF